MKPRVDFVVVGGGVVGLTIAREILHRGWGTVCVLEKESEVGKHSSGRNSGVLHAGFYYSAESLKAKVCAEGAQRLFEYALEKKIKVLKTGKIVLPIGSNEEAMGVLKERAKANGIVLEWVDRKQILEIEPEANPVDRALYSPNTAVIDSVGVLNALVAEIESAPQGEVKTSAEVSQVDYGSGTCVLTHGDRLQFGHMINAAGLHADRVSKMAGIGTHYRLLPFKGVYRKLTPAAASRFRGSIYPVPDLELPFLGVHVTRNIFGDVYLGPTAIPAWGRENYRGLEGIAMGDALSIATSLGGMMIRNTQNMRRYCRQEIRKYGRRSFLKDVQLIAPNLRAEDMTETTKVGLRPQLFDVRTKRLEMDFIVENGPRSTHVLNAISPGFTSSFAFAKWVADRVQKDGS